MKQNQTEIVQSPTDKWLRALARNGFSAVACCWKTQASFLDKFFSAVDCWVHSWIYHNLHKPTYVHFILGNYALINSYVHGSPFKKYLCMYESAFESVFISMILAWELGIHSWTSLHLRNPYIITIDVFSFFGMWLLRGIHSRTTLGHVKSTWVSLN